MAFDLEEPVRTNHERARRERAQDRRGKVQELPRLCKDRLPGHRMHRQEQARDQPHHLQWLLPLQSGVQVWSDQRVRF